MNNDKLSIDITRKEPVMGTSAPKVTSVTWNPDDSASRSADIALARQKAFEEHQEYLKSLTPEEKRLRSIETRLEVIENALKQSV
jgi:hypothetical protein